MIGNEAANPFVGEHAQLVATAERLIRHLRRTHAALQPIGDVSYAEHYDFAERALSLSLYLDTALQSAAVGFYPGSFALLRSALSIS